MIEGVTVWAALAFGGAAPPELEVGGGVVVEVDARIPSLRGPQRGMTFPHLAVVDSRREDPRVWGRYAVPGVVRHEMKHLAQWSALGPGFALAYLAGWGRGFEPYRGDGVVWRADERRCPLLRSAGGEVHWLPCWWPP